MTKTPDGDDLAGGKVMETSMKGRTQQQAPIGRSREGRPRTVRYHLDRDRRLVVRRVEDRCGGTHESVVPAPPAAAGDARAAFDLGWLGPREAPPSPRPRARVRIADMFAGCGGLTLGIAEACRALALRPVPALA